jgi:hypothetical protein
MATPCLRACIFHYFQVIDLTIFAVFFAIFGLEARDFVLWSCGFGRGNLFCTDVGCSFYRKF